MAPSWQVHASCEARNRTRGRCCGFIEVNQYRIHGHARASQHGVNRPLASEAPDFTTWVWKKASTSSPMDYVEGQNLAQLVGNPKAARYVKLIAEGIHYAHQQGILHR